MNPKDCIMIGDTEYDMEMARNAGMDAIGVSYGVHEEERLYDSGAMYVAAQCMYAKVLTKSPNGCCQG